MNPVRIADESHSRLLRPGALLELYVIGSYVSSDVPKPVVFVGTVHDVKETPGCIILMSNTGLMWLAVRIADDWLSMGLLSVVIPERSACCNDDRRLNQACDRRQRGARWKRHDGDASEPRH